MTEIDDSLYQGSQTSKFFGGLSFILLLIGVGVLVGGHWLIAIVCIVVGITAGFVGYKLSGGRENPQLYSNLDLFGLVDYAVRSGNARIGFHSMRNQESIISVLQTAGISFPSTDIRQEIRKLITKDRRAFEACRDLMVIQTVHGGREYFWNGFGEPKPVQWFHEAEIIIDIQSNTKALINRLFELVSQDGKLKNAD